MKKSFADCSKCPFFNMDGKICETNTPKNLIDIDQLFIIDNVSEWQKLSIELNKKNHRYLITSPVLCGDTFNQDAQKICSANTLAIFNKCRPKETILIGSVSKTFSGPAFIKHEFNTVGDYLLSKEEVDYFADLKNEKGEKIEPPKEVTKKSSGMMEFRSPSDKNEMYMFTIPEEFYTPDYRLIDVQNISNQSRIIYIFRDKNNKKIFFEPPIKEDDFYWYDSSSNDNKIIEEYQNLELKIGNYKERNQEPNGYGGDTNITALHSIDYFLQTKGEAPILGKNILHFDMEVYTFKNRTFPDPTISQFPINAISFRTSEGSTRQIFLLKIPNEIDPQIDQLIESKKYPNLTVFTDEYTLVLAFLKRIQELQPDFICGWNSNDFDIPYLVGRMKKLNIPMKELSPYGNVYADARGRVIITGYIALDQLTMYKNFSYINLPSYKLDAVAEKEIGQKKVVYEGNLDSLYNDNIDKFVEYSLTDTDLIKGIEDRCHHVSIQDELRRITTTSHSGAASTIGQAEGLFLTSMKKQGLIARNSKHCQKEELPGAYVFEPVGGLYDGLLCDFDFQSLYPSIINTWNIGPDTFLAKFINDEIAFDYLYNKQQLKGKKFSLIIDPVHSSKIVEMNIDDLDKLIAEHKATVNVAGTIFTGHDKHISIFNTAVSLLFNGRKVYKKKMLECKEKGDKAGAVENNGKQMAYKILANSLYGVLSNEHFKFYNNDLAKSITLTGQELLKYCTVHCDNFMKKRDLNAPFEFDLKFMDRVTNLTDVLYGDTDSMFVYLTDYLNDLKIEVKKSPQVTKCIDAIQSHINKEAISFFLKLHNVPPEKSMIFLKNEYLFSKYYTLSGKKHYAAKVISQEGRDIQDTEIKGLEIKRSEIPKKSQELLSEILDIILDETISKDSILDKIDVVIDKRKKEMLDLIEARDNSVVRTVSYSKPLSEYKNLPQHIKAMMMWNVLINEDFRYGSKGKLWNIQGIDLDKAPESVRNNYNTKFLLKYNRDDLDCICIPEEVSKLPMWFIPDTKKIIDYCCDDRANNLIEPLRKKVDLLLTF